jgi:arachidonate 15-lipoxygenase
MTAFLPQHVSPAYQYDRNDKLQSRRAQYKYDYSHVSPLAVLQELSIEDEFSFRWIEAVALRVLEVTANHVELEIESDWKSHHHKKHSVLRELLEIGESGAHKIKELIMSALKFDGRFTAPARRAQALHEFADLFKTFGLPPIAKDFAEDRVFAAMRVAGPNPVMLQRMTAPDERLPITDAMFQVAAPGDTLRAAIAEGRLYLADYALLDGAELGTYPNGQKYLYAPLALFVVTQSGKELLPVAIQCQQKPAPLNPILTPDDGYNWMIAKTVVEIADANIHEASTHLGRTHLAMEPFVISTFRQLAENHPLYLLLVPHFEGTLAINKAAWQHLIADKGGVDKLMGGTIKTSRGVAVQGVQTLHVMNDLLPLTFAKRGVADRKLLPVYPFRDDALLYWDAIYEWVGTYVRLYYHENTDVQQDVELQAWAREISADDGGRLKGLPNSGSIQQVSELIDVVTFVIYTCSVQHAAVNFPQFDCMSYVPNMPCAGYKPAPTTKTGATEADFVDMLPPLDMAELQMELGFLLGKVHYTKLGHYAHGAFGDARVRRPLEHFQKRVADIGMTIAERNTERRPYDTLAPDGIPQSINI